MSNKKLLSTALVATASMSMVGCFVEYQEPVKNNYDATAYAAENNLTLDRSVYFLGDSHIDNAGYIPKKLAQLTGVVYGEGAWFAARIGEIENVQPDHKAVHQYTEMRAQDIADDSYSVNTVILAVGGNDMNQMCNTWRFDNVASAEADCNDALERVRTKLTRLMSEMTTGSYGSDDPTTDAYKVNNVLLMGAHYIRGSLGPENIVNKYSELQKSICDQFPACHFVEWRKGFANDGYDQYRWDYAEAQIKGDEAFILGDKKHMTEKGGNYLGNLIYSKMQDLNLL